MKARFPASMMTMQGVFAIAAILLFMASSASAWGTGWAFCTCYVNGRLIYGTTITSPDGSFSYCSCDGYTPKPPQTPPGKTPPPKKKPPPSPASHTPSKNPPPSPASHTPSKNPPPSPASHTPSKNPPPAPPTPVKPAPAIQLPPLQILSPADRACLDQIINVSACLPQITLAYVQPQCCQQLKCLTQTCASTIFRKLNLPAYQKVFNAYCCNRA